MGLDRCQQNTATVQNIPSYPIFFERPSAVPEQFFELRESKFLLEVSG
jgi:hypothetical protein